MESGVGFPYCRCIKGFSGNFEEEASSILIKRRKIDDVWPSLEVVAFTVLEPKKYIAGANINPITAIVANTILL